VIVGKPPPPNLTPQQLPGRVVVVRAELIRDVLGGRVIVFPANAVLSGGAVPPVVATTRPGGAVRRADIQSRSVKRDPRMNGVTLAYMTKTKTPAEALSLVFDYSNWPEIVGGAKVLSAVITGAGGVPLTGLVAGTPEVLSVATVVDHLGNTVAANKGARVEFFGGAAGEDVIVECSAIFDSGPHPRGIQCLIAVRNAR